MRALYSAATGMMAQELNVQVISNNIANMRTTGYKRQQAHFQDLLYQTLRRAGATTSEQGTQTPAAIEVGSGVKAVSTARAMTQGNLTPTERDFDVAIRGEGFFQIRLPDGRAAFSRDGGFDLDAQGRLVTKDGYEVEPGIVIPQNVRTVSIGASGVVEITTADQAEPQEVGRLQLTRFVNKSGLESIGDNLFLQTAASGEPVQGNPTAEGFGSLQQGYLEEANVNAVTEISALISAQRAYEMNSRVISAADQMLQAATQMFRG
ncbi:flagellar basal-body rod protein FlgG [Salinarimonas sp.]|uniref:flagellar basal-body rod protein FlgG n=1 Tax=Salinarimonas sp. TaxID=2766526 RepID=UPI0032D96B66